MANAAAKKAAAGTTLNSLFVVFHGVLNALFRKLIVIPYTRLPL
jgi:hypothetical protein